MISGLGEIVAHSINSVAALHYNSALLVLQVLHPLAQTDGRTTHSGTMRFSTSSELKTLKNLVQQEIKP